MNILHKQRQDSLGIEWHKLKRGRMMNKKTSRTKRDETLEGKSFNFANEFASQRPGDWQTEI